MTDILLSSSKVLFLLRLGDIAHADQRFGMVKSEFFLARLFRCHKQRFSSLPSASKVIH
jgi:hypothetical protein